MNRMLFIVLQLLLLTVVLISCATNETISQHGRNKRWLIFPRAAPTRQQFIAGIGIPIDLGSDGFAITYGYSVKAQYFLPYNVSQLRLPFFYDKKGKSKRAIYEKYEAQPDELKSKVTYDTDGFQPENDGVDYADTGSTAEDVEKFDNLRWNMYSSIEKMIDGLGHDGRACMLRTICNSADLPLSISSGLLAEIFHIVLTPSTTNEKIVTNTDNQYFRAEELGKHGAPCDRIFSECRFSLMNVFSKIYNPLELMKNILF